MNPFRRHLPRTAAGTLLPAELLLRNGITRYAMNPRPHPSRTQQ